jgi:dihydrofolate reductase/thymidylate synthase
MYNTGVDRRSNPHQQVVSLIFAVDDALRLGVDGGLPWTLGALPEDLCRFKNLTLHHTVVMGRRTYASLPEKSRPLPDRRNVVITRDPSAHSEEANRYGSDRLVFITEDEADGFLSGSGDYFVIGGARVFSRFIHKASRAYVTQVHMRRNNNTTNTAVHTTYFPVESKFGESFRLVESACSPLMVSNDPSVVSYRFLQYDREDTPRHEERTEYMALLERLLSSESRPDRTGVGTLSAFGQHIRFNLTGNIVPVMTTKRMAWKTIVKELLWFLRGRPDVTALEEDGVRVWSANSSRSFLDSRGLQRYREGDVGPMYPFVFRHFGARYEGCDANYEGKGLDQLERLVRGIREDPYSRRHLLTTFDPSSIDACALPPCHGIAIQFYVHGGDTRGLSCHVYCRSSDVFLGLPFNITSYAVFVHIIAKRCDLQPCELVMSLGDVHLYKTHVAQTREQLTRPPLPFPALRVADKVKNAPWERIEADDFEMVGYMHHPTIRADMAV